MNLVDSLRKQIDSLPPGEYKPGLEAVLLHLDTAFRHRQRGIDKGDDTAFTDAIYRSNQAFEGSIKEAYRVLAGMDPGRTTPFKIETYFENNQVFRERVLKQFTNYRIEWRNPSTHDYKLDFDQSEALLAIVTVAAFSSMVLDQIAERISYLKTVEEVEAQRSSTDIPRASAHGMSLQMSVAALLKEFSKTHTGAAVGGGAQSESQVLGALRGFLDTRDPDLRVQSEYLLNKDKPFRADLFVTRGDERVIVEIKRRLHRSTYHNSLAQLEHYMLIGSISAGVLLFLQPDGAPLEERSVPVEQINGSITVLASKEA